MRYLLLAVLITGCQTAALDCPTSDNPRIRECGKDAPKPVTKDDGSGSAAGDVLHTIGTVLGGGGD